MISKACKKCEYYNTEAEFDCSFTEGTEIRCNILKGYLRWKKFYQTSKGEI